MTAVNKNKRGKAEMRGDIRQLFIGVTANHSFINKGADTEAAKEKSHE